MNMDAATLYIRQNTCKTDVEVVTDKSTFSVDEFKNHLKQKPKEFFITREEGDFNINGISVECDCPMCLLKMFVCNTQKYAYQIINHQYKNGSRISVIKYSSDLSCQGEVSKQGEVCKFYKREIKKISNTHLKDEYQNEFQYKDYINLGSPRFIAAPMIGQSELAFRMFVRQYGAHLCYSPMIDTELFLHSKEYQIELLHSCEEDKPLVAQIAGSNIDSMFTAAKQLVNYCNAIDINLGCPQPIARRNYYGAWMMENWQLIADIIAKIKNELFIPVFCKIRIFDSLDLTIEYAKTLADSGCTLLTVHGRPRRSNFNLEPANWEYIKTVKAALNIPVVANGSISTFNEAIDCLSKTRCDGVMAASGLLKNPALFSEKQCITPKNLALEYLLFADKYKATLRYVKPHIFYMLQPMFPKIMNQLHPLNSILEIYKLIKNLPEKQMQTSAAPSNDFQSLFDCLDS